MTNYVIESPSFTALLVVDSDYVFQSAPLLSWTVGQPWTYVRTQLQARGWIIVPVIDDYHPTWIEVDNKVYELKWSEHVPASLMRITLHEDGEMRDLPYRELPDKLRHLL